MESERHRAQMNILIDTLEAAWRGRDDFYVGGNMFVYFSETQARNNDFRGPDVFVVLNTERKERESWVVWEEGGRTPDVVIELLSPSTEAVDRGVKMDLYARVLKVSWYFLYDPFTLVFEGYRLDLDAMEYEPLTPEADGSLRCDLLGLYLGIRDTSIGYKEQIPALRWLDAAGAPLPLGAELAARAESKAAEAESKAAEAESKAAEAESKAAEAESKAAEAESKAAAERARAEALEARLAELEAKLSGGPS